LEANVAELIFQKDLTPRTTRTRELITNPDDLATAFEYARKHPMWKREPILRKVSPKVAREALALYNKVVAEGRHVAEFHRDPLGVAKRFKVDISDETVAVLTTVGSKLGASANFGGAVIVISVAVVAVAVTTATVGAAADPRSKIVIDQSGRVKI
jgi:hypothetical protein